MASRSKGPEAPLRPHGSWPFPGSFHPTYRFPVRPYRQTRYSRRPAPVQQQRRGFCPDRAPVATGAACTRAHGFEGRRPDYNRGCPGCARPPSFAHRYHRSHGMRGGPCGVGRPARKAHRRGLRGRRRERRRHGRPGHGAARARPWYRRRPAFLAPNSRDLYGPPRPPHWDLSVVFLSGHLAVCQKGFILRGSHGPLAQLVEQLTLNQVVPGSSPGRPTNPLP